MRTVLSTVERLVFRGDAMDVARANAWAAVQRDRERARERAEAWAAWGAGVGTTAAAVAAVAAEHDEQL